MEEKGNSPRECERLRRLLNTNFGKVRRSRREPEISVTIQTDDELGEKLIETVTAVLQKENRRRVHGGGKGIGYRVELISSKHS